MTAVDPTLGFRLAGTGGGVAGVGATPCKQLYSFGSVTGSETERDTASMTDTRSENVARTVRPDAPGRRPMDMQKGWLHQDAVAVLRRLILSGDLPPGERLREIPISERLGVSRTPVREAFRTLAAEGLLDLLPNRSVVVSHINSEDAADGFAVLAVLEGLAGEFACQRMTGDQVNALEDLQDLLEDQFQKADRVGYTETNRQIHELIMESSHNASLIVAWRMILPRVQRARTLNNLDRRRWAEAVDEHRQILEAIRRRDAEAVSALFRRHFDKGAQSILKHK